jgi:aspartyl-tRNA(Asn)/glutamyl-tRNA(Gln) amidotransferase subunit B
MTKAKAYEATIGLEVHVQLKTRAKLFCGCANDFGGAPNTRTCPVCLGHPGTLPVLNGAALRLAVKAAAALACRIPDRLWFDRKNYFYADLPKGFQISQHFSAAGWDGAVAYWAEEGYGSVAVERVHLEEDVARAVHDEPYVAAGETLLDFNRAGVPLLEVVSRPVITSPGEARRYVVALRQTLLEAGVSDCDLEKGAFRIDTNISVKPRGADRLGEQVEIKNLNSLRAMEAALTYEYERQVGLIQAGGRVVRETMLYDEAAGRTFPTRAKELRADYRYFAEPDLPAVQLTEDFVAGVRAELGPAPATRVRELREGYAATAAEAELIAFTPGYYAFLAGAAAAYGGERRALVNWLVGDVTRELNARGQRLDECRLTPAAFAALLGLLDGGALNVPAAREVLAALMTEGGEPAAIIAARGLGQVSDAAALAALVREAFEHNPRAVADVRAGKDKARAALVGYVMKKTGGRANPAVVNDCIAELLKKG